MAVICAGKWNDKYLIVVDEPNVRLKFGGPDADQFEQFNPPASGKQVREAEFNCSVCYLETYVPGFLNDLGLWVRHPNSSGHYGNVSGDPLLTNDLKEIQDLARQAGFEEVINQTIEAYRRGVTVVIFSTSGGVIHGLEDIEQLARGEFLAYKIDGIDYEKWFATVAPSLMLAVRRICWPKDND
jgi:hypothetical protein